MGTKAKKILKIIAYSALIIVVSFFTLLYTGIIWRSPGYYAINEERKSDVPIMTMEEFSKSEGYDRPYIFRLKKGKGEVYVLGIDHTRNKKNCQIDSVVKIWNSFKPDVALVEGRLGFLMSGLQDPVEVHGEGGKTYELARKDKIEIYT